jgi:L-threonylcarbamoyladenylate synthase
MKFKLHESHAVQEVVKGLRSGAVIAYPTEAVFGLGCDPENASAVQRIYKVKSRPTSKGLILIAGSVEHINRYVDWDSVDADVYAQVRSTWPGPQTWILPARSCVDRALTGGGSGIAVRVTAHQPAAALCNAFAGALVSTSANPSGIAPARSVQSADKYFGSEVEFYLDDVVGPQAKPTSIRDARNGRVLRD